MSTPRAGALRATGAQLARKGGDRYHGGALRTPVIWYLMRATRVSTGLRIYWESHSTADLTGARSGHPGDVTDITVLGTRPDRP